MIDVPMVVERNKAVLSRMLNEKGRKERKR